MHFTAILKPLFDSPLGRFLFNIRKETTLGENLDIVWRNPLPGWLILLIALPVAALVVLVYYKEASSAGRWAKIIMAVMRLLIVALVLIIFMEPTIKSVQVKESPSTILIMIDTSNSMAFNDPGLEDAKAKSLADALHLAVGSDEENQAAVRDMSRLDMVKEFIAGPDMNLFRQLEEKGVVKVVTFSRGVKYDTVMIDAEDPEARAEEFKKKLAGLQPDGTETNVPKAVIDALEQARTEVNVSAVILISDGRTTSFSGDAEKTQTDYQERLIDEVLADSHNKDIKIFTFLVGDLKQPRDIIMRGIEGPSQISKDSQIRIDVTATQVQFIKGEFKVRLFVTDVTKKQARRELVDNGERTIKMTPLADNRTTKEVKITFDVKPEGKGSWLYTAEIEPLEKEADRFNNHTESGLFVDVTDKRLKILIVEGTPRWEYRFIKNVLIRNRDEFVVWTLLLSADEGFPQEHTAGDYFNEHGIRVPIEPLETFPTPEKLNTFDVIIWGDVNPGTTCYGITEDTLEQVASWVTRGSAVAEGDSPSAAAAGGGVIGILGEHFFPRAYRDINPSSDDDITLRQILPFKIVDSPISPEELYGDQKKPFKYRIRLEFRDSELLRFYSDPEKNLEYWEKPSEAEIHRLPGSYWFWPIEEPSADARVFVEHPEKKIQGEDEDSRNKGKSYPLMLDRRAGKGRVFVMAIDDTWRWRYEIGDKFFAKFWIRLIKTVAEGGTTLRQFSLKTDREKYIKGSGQEISATAIVLGKDLKPIDRDRIKVTYQRKVAGSRHKEGEESPEEASEKKVIILEAVKKKIEDGERLTGEYAGKIGLKDLEPGPYRLWLDKECTEEEDIAAHFVVKEVDAEKIDRTGYLGFLDALAYRGKTGKARDLTQLAGVAGEFESPREEVQVSISRIAIWAAWITLFIALIVLCLEWIIRKLRRLI